MQKELAHILDELRASDTALPFAERLRARALEWAQISGIALDLDLGDVPGIAPANQETLLRIVDEALANALRHSGATRVRLSISRASAWRFRARATHWRSTSRIMAAAQAIRPSPAWVWQTCANVPNRCRKAASSSTAGSAKEHGSAFVFPSPKRTTQLHEQHT